MTNCITIVAGGWSAKKIVEQTNLPGLIIAVNDSAYHLPRCDIVCSMDRKWTEDRWDWLCEKKLPAFIRSQALKRITQRPEWLTVFECNHETPILANGQNASGVWYLNGTNSGACAFNLAYVTAKACAYLFGGPDNLSRIFLVGFDMQYGPNGEYHWYPVQAGTPGKVASDWAGQFINAQERCNTAGIEVFTVGDYSLITAFPRIRPEQMNA